MAKLLKLRRGTTSQHSSFTGAEGEVTVDTDKETLVVHDGSTAGGHPVAAEDMANVSSGSITGRLGTGSIARAKLAADVIDGTKLADDSVNSEHIVADSIDAEHYAPNSVNDDALSHTGVSAASYGSATAIPAITVNAQGRITAASTNTVNTTTNLATTTASGSVTITSSTGNNATISEATSSAAGVMSTAHHDKLDGIAAGATNVTNTNQLTNGAGFVTSSGNTIIGTDSDIDTSGATVIDQINMTDGVIQSHSTRTLTLANLGYTGATNANYITNNNQLSNGASYITSSNGAITNKMPLAGGTFTGTVISQHVRPANNAQFDLGTSSYRYANVYTNDLHLSNEGHTNDIDGSWGDWTIQEGESDLFLKNNRSGKKYKFNLTEVS